MQISIIIALVIAIVAVIFALQNLAVVTVAFLGLNVQSSLALVLLVTLAAGVLISFLASFPGLVRGKWTISSQKKRLAAMENERDSYRRKVDDYENDIHNLEEQLANLSAELEKYQPAEAKS